ncbi:hypothetical protein SAMN05518684_11355 [Salipaludibacillus aurantiacus]|uniref:Uncharacterized protein n=1 Tax=Salipaludibacillus aurantiacus TaxID=1601833 RepID=A0A1H9VYD3_9BACI|nr:hypothetical protein SAMN05518684_11355 [Salipaludibacillus aurantiacus]
MVCLAVDSGKSCTLSLTKNPANRLPGSPMKRYEWVVTEAVLPMSSPFLARGLNLALKNLSVGGS